MSTDEFPDQGPVSGEADITPEVLERKKAFEKKHGMTEPFPNVEEFLLAEQVAGNDPLSPGEGMAVPSPEKKNVEPSSDIEGNAEVIGVSRELVDELHRYVEEESELARAKKDIENITRIPEEKRTTEDVVILKEAEAYIQSVTPAHLASDVLSRVTSVVRSVLHISEKDERKIVDDATATYANKKPIVTENAYVDTRAPADPGEREFVRRAEGRQRDFSAKLEELGLGAHAKRIYERLFAEARERVMASYDRERKVGEAKVYMAERKHKGMEDREYARNEKNELGALDSLYGDRIVSVLSGEGGVKLPGGDEKKDIVTTPPLPPIAPPSPQSETYRDAQTKKRDARIAKIVEDVKKRAGVSGFSGRQLDDMTESGQFKEMGNDTTAEEEEEIREETRKRRDAQTLSDAETAMREAGSLTFAELKKKIGASNRLMKRALQGLIARGVVKEGEGGVYEFVQGPTPDVPPPPNNESLVPPTSAPEIPAPDMKEGGEKKEEPPLTPDEFFPGEELEKILRAPTAERKELLRVYKEKLMEQKRGIAEMSAFLTEKIRENPDMTPEKMNAIVEEFSGRLKMNGDQREITHQILEKYRNAHEAVNKARKDFPDDTELFRALFGQSPKGEVEIIAGLMTLCVRFYDLEDYASFFHGKHLSQFASPLSGEEKDSANRSGGCAGIPVLIPELSGLVIAEKVTTASAGKRDQGIYDHEEQHAINRIVQRITREKFSFAENGHETEELVKRYWVTQDALHGAGGSGITPELASIAQELDIVDRRRLRAIRERDVDPRAQDEILAYTKDGRSMSEIYEKLTRKEKDGGLYDYLPPEKLVLRSPQLLLHLQQLTNAHWVAPELESDFEKRKEDILVREYHEVLRSGLSAYQLLRDAGYKEEAIRGIFHDEPLRRWEKVARRLAPNVPMPELFPSATGIPEPEEEKMVPARPEDISDAVLNFEYAQEMNFTKEELARIPGFAELSEGQQYFVLREFAELSAMEKKGGALRAYDEKMKSLAGGLTEGEERYLKDGVLPAFARKFIVGVGQLRKASTWQRVGLNLTKGKWLADKEHELEEDLRGERLSFERFKTLEALVESAKEGPELVVKDGIIVGTNFVKESQFSTELHPEEAKLIIREFNIEAHAFANIPHAWSEHEAIPEEREEYQKAEERFSRALSTLQELMTEANGEEYALSTAFSLEHKIKMNQLLHDRPLAEGFLADFATRFEDNSYARWASTLVQERGRAFLAGGALRTAATFATTTLAAPIALVAAPFVGGLVGKMTAEKRAHTSLKDREKLAKMGIEDTSEEAQRNIRSARDLSDKIVLLEKKLSLIQELPSTEENKEEEERIRASLHLRYAYTKEKLDEGLVSFSGGAEGIAERNRLVQKLGYAGCVNEFDEEWNSRGQEKLNAHILRVGADISEKQKEFIHKTAYTGAKWGAIFGSAGALVADMFHGGGIRSMVSGAGSGDKNILAPAMEGLGGKGEDIISPPSASTPSPSASAPEANGGVTSDTAKGVSENDVEVDEVDVPWKLEDFDKNISEEILRGASRKSLSPEELSALRATGGLNDARTANVDAHQALIVAMRESKDAPLTKEYIDEIVKRYSSPAPQGGDGTGGEGTLLNPAESSPGEGDGVTSGKKPEPVSSSPRGESVPGDAPRNGEIPPLAEETQRHHHDPLYEAPTEKGSPAVNIENPPTIHTVVSGENLTKIFKAEGISEAQFRVGLAKLHALNLSGKELETLDAELGFSTNKPNLIHPGDKINISKFVEFTGARGGAGTGAPVGHVPGVVPRPLGLESTPLDKLSDTPASEILEKGMHVGDISEEEIARATKDLSDAHRFAELGGSPARGEKFGDFVARGRASIVKGWISNPNEAPNSVPVSPEDLPPQIRQSEDIDVAVPSREVADLRTGMMKVGVKEDLARMSGMERAEFIAGKWSRVAKEGMGNGPHWEEVRNTPIVELMKSGKNYGETLDGARWQAHRLVNLSEQMGFRPIGSETGGEYLDRVAKELATPLTNEATLLRSHIIWEVINRSLPFHGNARTPSADVIMARQVDRGMVATREGMIPIARTPEGEEFLRWKAVLSEIQKNTGISPRSGESIQDYAERAIRIKLRAYPSLHAHMILPATKSF